MNTVKMIYKLWNIVADAAQSHETAEELRLFFDFVDARLLYTKAYCLSEAGLYDEAMAEMNQMDDTLDMLVAKVAELVAHDEAFYGNFCKAYDALEDVIEAYLLRDYGANQWMCSQLNPAYLK